MKIGISYRQVWSHPSSFSCKLLCCFVVLLRIAVKYDSCAALWGGLVCWAKRGTDRIEEVAEERLFQRLQHRQLVWRTAARLLQKAAQYPSPAYCHIFTVYWWAFNTNLNLSRLPQHADLPAFILIHKCSLRNASVFSNQLSVNTWPWQWLQAHSNAENAHCVWYTTCIETAIFELTMTTLLFRRDWQRPAASLGWLRRSWFVAQVHWLLQGQGTPEWLQSFGACSRW